MSFGRRRMAPVTPNGSRPEPTARIPCPRTALVCSLPTEGAVWTLAGSRSMVIPTPSRCYSSSFNETGAVVSPDGQWMAYEADDSGTLEVYVRPFPNVDDGRWQISAAGGAEPVWGPAGRELFYRTGFEVVVVAISEGPTSTWSSPIALFADQYVPRQGGYSRYYDVAPDGRFLMILARRWRAATWSSSSIGPRSSTASSRRTNVPLARHPPRRV